MRKKPYKIDNDGNITIKEAGTYQIILTTGNGKVQINIFGIICILLFILSLVGFGAIAVYGGLWSFN